MSNEDKTSLLCAVYSFSGKLSDELLCPELAQIERSACDVLRHGFIASTPKFNPFQIENQSLRNTTIDLSDMDDCLRLAHGYRHHIRQAAFQLPQIQVALQSWQEHALGFLDTIDDALRRFITAAADARLSDSPLLACFRSQCLARIVLLKAKCQDCLVNFVATCSRPYSQRDDLPLRILALVAGYQARGLSTPCAENVYVLAEVKVLFEIMQENILDSIVMSVRALFWDEIIGILRHNPFTDFEEVLRILHS